MSLIDKLQLTAQIAALAAERLMELGPGKPDETKQVELAALDESLLCAPHKPRDRKAATACLAGLWLLHDFHEQSHSISQELHTPEGSYWHAILHRREPDYVNAKYWFRQVGSHAIYAPLCQAAKGLVVGLAPAPVEARYLESQAAWQPMRFVDLCETAAGDESLRLLCRQIQLAEWQLLFAHCFRSALGS